MIVNVQTSTLAFKNEPAVAHQASYLRFALTIKEYGSMTHFPGRMLESAHNYLKAAELLDAQNLPHVAMVNAAIGMEILLKSFISVPDQHQGTSGETYKLDVEALKAAHQHLQSIGKIPPKQKHDAHDLLTVFHAMPAAIRQTLALDSQEGTFERYRDVFTNSRYLYESSSWKFSDPVLMRLLRWTLANVVGYYKERGSQDPFVLGYMRTGTSCSTG